MNPNEIAETIRRAYEPVKAGRLSNDYLIALVINEFARRLASAHGDAFDSQTFIDTIYGTTTV